jgi:hypothetical protein
MGFPGLTSDLPPVAMAGTDIFINQPAVTAILNGSVYDANGDVPSVTWTQISGPNTAAFSSTDAITPTILNLVPGTYTFRITATAGGKTDYDEVSVTLGPPNIALGKPVTASSAESSSTPASAANDGSLSTRWSSAFSDPQWIRIDLQSVYNLSGARIFWEAAASRNFEIQVSSNGTTWASVYSTSSGDGGTDSFVFSSAARYVRMNSTARTSQYGNSIFEFEVFGTLQTGIEDMQSCGSFDVYPNPVNGEMITVSFGDDWVEEEVQLSVTGMSGHPVYSETVRIAVGRIVELSLPGNGMMKPGLYILTVTGSRITSQTKLIIRQ